MKLRDDGGLDPHAERELAAIDDALAGRPVDPDLASLGELASLLGEERPEPGEAWAAGLDRRAASRFRTEGGGGSWRETWGRLRALPPRRIAGPVGALATLAVATAIGVSTLSGGDDVAGDLSSQPERPLTAPPLEGEGAAGAATDLEPRSSGPSVQAQAAERRALRADTSRLSPGTESRQVDRDVSMRLSAQPDEVRDVSDEVIAITRSSEGIVVSSRVSEQGKDSTASLELSIPSANLDDAIDQLSDLAHVDSLNETTEDITHPFVTARDELRDAEAERKSLLQALESATTEAEADALRAQIADASERIARARARYENIARQARWSTVSVQVVAGRNAEDPRGEGDRSLGDWADDALDVLRDVAGVLLVTAAIVVPLGLLVAIAGLAAAWARRRRRERALDP